MQKTKLAFVTLLSLLVVLAPVSSVLAKTEPVDSSQKQVLVKKESKEKAPAQSSVFEKIESQGGDEVSEKRLDQKEGEGWFGAAVGVVTGAISGSATSLGHYLWNKSVMGHEVPDVHKVAHKAKMGAAVGAASGAFFGGVIGGPF
ncbi:hypothetical protein KGY79_08260 [Candidatus Bipolaricaulota bacterium]|nr:hypothetical protein [Candidatus Bipolaricaulota bacterium]